jgi:hypothetical protein
MGNIANIDVIGSVKNAIKNNIACSNHRSIISS